MKRARRLERLIRVRRAERDRERLAHRARSAESEAARTRLDETRHAIDGARRGFADGTRSGANPAWWRAAFAGIANLRQGALAARHAVDEAASAEADAHARLVESSRRLRGAERLAERAARAARQEAARRAQKKLDDGARRRGAGAIALLFFALSPLSLAGTSQAEEASVPNTGVAMLIDEIRVRQAELDTREREIDDREAHVAELEAGIATRLDELQKLIAAVEERISNWERAHEDKQLSRLSKIYGSMEPRTAARLLEDLDLDLATRIIAKMKHKQSAALLPLISQPRALAMSRSVAHPLGNPALPPENTP